MKADAMECKRSYHEWLKAYGLTDEQAQEMSANHSDRILWTDREKQLIDALVYRDRSEIAGWGYFAWVLLRPWFVLGAARKNGRRTPFGFGLNHSPTPNARFVLTARGDLLLMTLESVAVGDEITVSYFDSAQVNGAE